MKRLYTLTVALLKRPRALTVVLTLKERTGTLMADHMFLGLALLMSRSKEQKLDAAFRFSWVSVGDRRGIRGENRVGSV